MLEAEFAVAFASTIGAVPLYICTVIGVASPEDTKIPLSRVDTSLSYSLNEEDKAKVKDNKFSLLVIEGDDIAQPLLQISNIVFSEIMIPKYVYQTA